MNQHGESQSSLPMKTDHDLEGHTLDPSSSMITITEQQESALRCEDTPVPCDGYTLCWKDISYSIMDKKTKSRRDILSNVNGMARPGDRVAILGGSGAGKTTFLDTLAGRKPSSHVRGRIYVNGMVNVTMKHISRYCQQEDALLGHLTVYENLMYAARFTLPQSLTRKERHQIVMDLIHDMGLDKVTHTVIGNPFFKGCSGGQIRRVSVASQIIGFQSGILFLDEPTSGLDSVAALAVMTSVTEIAKRNNATLFATLHQPSARILNQFTHIMMMGNGKCVFYGRREDALVFFTSIGRPLPPEINPSDFYLEMINVDFSDDSEKDLETFQELVDAYNASSYHEEIETSIRQELSLSTFSHRKIPTTVHSNSFLHQTSILVSRGFYNSLKNPMAFAFRALVSILLAVFQGTVWLRLSTSQTTVQDRLSSLFSCVGFLSFMAMAAIPVFLEERRVILRERANGLYGTGAYIIAQFVSSVPLFLLMTVTFSCIVYFLIGYQTSPKHFFVFLGTMLLTHVTADSQVILLSSILPSVVGASSLCSLTNAVLMISAGFLVPVSRLAAVWKYSVHYIDYIKYTFEILIANEFQGLTFECIPLSSYYMTSSSSNATTTLFNTFVPSTSFHQNTSNILSSSTLQNTTFCFCSIPTKNWDPRVCNFSGEDVLAYLKYDSSLDNTNTSFLWIVVYLIVIKILTYLVLKLIPQRGF